ncbi:MAG: hypothetical protein IJ129_05305 [Ruminococcus sp.]|nr:hypothetical protein [Ruminococcus sp.]
MKKVISTILGLLFVVIVVCGIFVCTYIFNNPSHEKGTDSRQFLLGYWVDEKQNIRLTFDEDSQFKITENKKGGKVMAKGYYKFDEDNKKIKLLVLPKDRDESLKLGEKAKFFATITYRNLKAEAEPEFETGVTFLEDYQKEELLKLKASATLVVSNCDTVFNVERTRTVLEFTDKNKDDDKD